MIHVRVLQDTDTKIAVPKTAGGFEFTVSLKSDGTVWGWGRNHVGQLGTGDSYDRSEPTQVRKNGGEPLTGIVDVAAGAYFAVAVDRDGQVWTWGYNNYGQLGGVTATGDHRLYAERVMLKAGEPEIPEVPAVPPVIDEENGEIITPGIPAVPGVPAVEAEYISDVIAVAAGDAYALALCKDGTVWAWGLNDQYQLGDFDYRDY